MQTISHTESWLKPEELGTSFPPYKPTYQISGDFINDEHRFYTTCPSNDDITINLGIKGWLRRDDALKLYELAYFSEGNVLELGSYNGLSTSIIAKAVAESPNKKSVVSVDLMCSHIVKTWFTLWKRGVSGNVSLKQGDAASVCKKLASQGKDYSFVFIDHSHAYEPVLDVCKVLDSVVASGGFCLFHDYNDERENNPDSSHGVTKAIEEALNKEIFEFYGIYGCAALYRKK